MIVATNIVAVVRLENPRRLSKFEGSGLDNVLQEGESEHKDNY